MSETQGQYLARISGYVEGKNHFKVLRRTVKKLFLLIKKAPRRMLFISPGPSMWSVGEILAHLAESELVFGYRLRRVLAANGATVEAFDQNLWQANAGYLKKDIMMSLQLFSVLRENNLSLLKSLTKEQWDAFGLHEERGKENISRMVELYAGHDVNHLKQIETIVSAKGKGERRKRKNA